MPDRSADGSSGRFWTTDDPDTTVPGRITLTPGWPRVEIYEPLVRSLRVISVREGVTEYEPADIGSEDLTVHGQLLGVAGNVTLLHARVVRLSSSVGGALQEQVLEGRHAVIGGHVEPDTTYKRVRFRVRFIEYWAELEGLAVTVEDPGGRVAIEYEAPTIEDALFSSIDGRVSFQSHWSLPQPEFTGISLRVRSWIYIDLAVGIPIEIVLNNYVLPTSVLLSLLFGKECPAVDVEVYNPESERWLTVISPGLGDDVLDRPAEPLLNRRMLTLDRVPSWIELFQGLTPLPQLVAGARESSRTVPNVLLELATAAEGLHRRLHPTERQLKQDEVTQAMAAIDESSANQNAKQILGDALRLYLWEPSFPKRLAQLAQECLVVAPGIVGNVNKWKRKVADARIGFAHQLSRDKPLTPNAVLEFAVLRDSLRWLLVIRLMLGLGVPEDTLRQRLLQHDPYRAFLRQAREALPDIYGADS